MSGRIYINQDEATELVRCAVAPLVLRLPWGARDLWVDPDVDDQRWAIAKLAEIRGKLRTYTTPDGVLVLDVGPGPIPETHRPCRLGEYVTVRGPGKHVSTHWLDTHNPSLPTLTVGPAGETNVLHLLGQSGVGTDWLDGEDVSRVTRVIQP